MPGNNKISTTFWTNGQAVVQSSVRKKQVSLYKVKLTHKAVINCMARLNRIHLQILKAQANKDFFKSGS